MKPAAEVVGKPDKVVRIGIEVVVPHRGDVAERDAIAEYQSTAAILCGDGRADAQSGEQKQPGNNTRDIHGLLLPRNGWLELIDNRSKLVTRSDVLSSGEEHKAGGTVGA